MNTPIDEKPTINDILGTLWFKAMSKSTEKNLVAQLNNDDAMLDEAKSDLLKAILASKPKPMVLDDGLNDATHFHAKALDQWEKEIKALFGVEDE